MSIMKKYFIVLMILIVLMGVFSMDILGRSIKDIQARMTGHVDYRINVVKGVVESENINKTYNCYIAGETVIYPNIPTFSRNPKLQPGDQVTIEFINGCRETPAILAPEDIRERPDTTVVIGEYIFVIYHTGGNFYLNRYTYAGVLDAELGILAEIVAGVPYKMHVDNDQNVYIFNIAYPWIHIRKYDKDGNYLFTKSVPADSDDIYRFSYIGPNGYLYIMDDNSIVKEINLSDLEVNQIYNLTGGHDYYYLTFDSDGYAYLYDKDLTPSGYVKWKLGVALVAAHAQANSSSSYDSFAIAGNYIGCDGSQLVGKTYTIAKALDADRVHWVLDDISTIYRMASTLNHFICLGIDVGGDLIMEKYTSGRVREWKTEVATVFTANLQYCGIAAYPF